MHRPIRDDLVRQGYVIEDLYPRGRFGGSCIHSSPPGLAKAEDAENAKRLHDEDAALIAAQGDADIP